MFRISAVMMSSNHEHNIKKTVQNNNNKTVLQTNKLTTQIHTTINECL